MTFCLKINVLIWRLTKFLNAWSQSLLQNKSLIQPLVNWFLWQIYSCFIFLHFDFADIILGVSFVFCILPIADDGKLEIWGRHPKLENSSGQHSSICHKINIVRRFIYWFIDFFHLSFYARFSFLMNCTFFMDKTKYCKINYFYIESHLVRSHILEMSCSVTFLWGERCSGNEVLMEAKIFTQNLTIQFELFLANHSIWTKALVHADWF